MAKYEFTVEDENEEQESKVEEGTKKPEIEVEIVDDTPEGDKGRKPLEKEVADPSEDELNEYSDKVKARINELTHARHDERRRREAIEREKEEAYRIAQATVNENNQLKKQLQDGTSIQVTQYQQIAENKLTAAKAKMRAAHEAGDSDALVEAQQEISSAVVELERAKYFKATPLQSQEKPANVPPNTPQQPPAAPPDEKYTRWRGNNSWFGTDRKLTLFALGVHDELVESGYDSKSDAYYNAIDKTMRDTFPARFKQDSDRVESEPTKKPATVVAPVSRGSAPNKIVLTKTQVALAKRLGVPLETYARSVAKLQQEQLNNG